jgi:hypothetical protein
MVWLEHPGKYVVCETTAAISTHLRLRELSPLKYGGGLTINTLCGRQAAWDTKIPVECVRCRECIAAAGGPAGRAEQDHGT